MFKKKHLQAMNREVLETNFLEIQDILETTIKEKQQISDEKRKILLIAKPFFEAFNNMDLSQAKEMSKIQIGFLVADLYKIVNDDDDKEAFSISSVFSKKQAPPKEKDYKEVVIKIAEKLATYGVIIPVGEPLKTTEESLVFIKEQILKA